MNEQLAREILQKFRDEAFAPGAGADSLWLYREALTILDDVMISGKINLKARMPLFRYNQDLHAAEGLLKDRLDRIKKTRAALGKAFEVALDMLVDQLSGGK